MYEIILMVCLVATPAHCEEQRPDWQEASYSTASCLFEGQIRAVEWAGQHPAWTVRGWRCGLPRA